ncbi:MAG: toll/interleukin-1 receptor domain-containing protein [Lachnospiraceae bacterium]|nr:toll/interleukin-1 receptor domain-containing protein [Lachnospiraceae bacterium]
MRKPKIFISYHRADKKYKDKIVSMLRERHYNYYEVDENTSFNGLKHQNIASQICAKVDDCDVLLCIVGKETFSRPHVDWELHAALKGDVKSRKGIIAVMLENRQDNKNDIDLNTFPTKLQENMDYIVLEQYATISGRIDYAVNLAENNRRDRRLQITHRNPVMELKSGLYFDN